MPQKLRIAFQGRRGAYSDLACRNAYPGCVTVPCNTFADAIECVHGGDADLAMLACENSLVGRVPDIHSLLPDSKLHIVGEHFQRVEHCLLGVKGAQISDIRRVHTHAVALGQIRNLILELDIEPVVAFDTAGAAELVAKWGRKEEAAVASSLAAELNGLEILRRNVEDAAHNTTRFYITAQHKADILPGDKGVMTTLVFQVRNVPSALYKALGGFATNGVNITRLESYMVDGSFTATQFLIDAQGHPEERSFHLALEELSFFAKKVNILGVYRQSSFRHSSADVSK